MPKDRARSKLRFSNARLHSAMVVLHLPEITMTDFRFLLADLRRPRLLIRAARFGMQEYQRERDLRRLGAPLASIERAVSKLFQDEEDMEQTRRAGDAGYSVARHIEVMIALMAEVRLLPRSTTI